MTVCNLCPRRCGAERSERSGKGFCRMGTLPVVARAAAHMWEEPCLSGTQGSGTVFFSGCTLGCVFCQNEPISHHELGQGMDAKQLCRLFQRVEELGVHNLNLVTPTHYVPMLARVLKEYNSPVPVVYNSSGYEKAETLKTLEGLVDIYLPDIKYFDSAPALKYSGAADYFEFASSAVLEMHRR